MRARSIVCHFFYLRAFASSYVRTRRGVDGRFGHPFFFQKKNHASASSSVLAHAASISSSYAVLGGGGVLGLENEGSRQDEDVLTFGIFLFASVSASVVAEMYCGGDVFTPRRLDTGTGVVAAVAAVAASRSWRRVWRRVCVFTLGSAGRDVVVASSRRHAGPRAHSPRVDARASPAARRVSLDSVASATSWEMSFPFSSISRRARTAGRPTSPSFVQRSNAGAMTCG